MAYSLEILSSVADQIIEQPEPFRGFIVACMQKLASAPTRVSRPQSANALGQLAEFKFERHGASLWLTFVFFYGQDEQLLHVERMKIEYGE